jgi:nucleoside-diphosphate-sugar epimerase
MSQTILITGAAGYVGAMLCDQLARRDDVQTIVGLDVEPLPDLLRGNTKVVWIQANTADAGWQAQAAVHAPSVVIHTAWHIREMYGNRTEEWRWNIIGTDAVAAFAFTQPGVTKYIHFSTVASYGSFPENTIEHRFTEDEPFRVSEYLYAEEKRIAEERLRADFERAKKTGQAVPQVFIIRPAAITGPRGRHMRVRFGLQSALSGTLKVEKRFIYDLITLWVSRVPITPKWLRQYVHEDDITDIVTLFAMTPVVGEYEICNASPPGPAVLGKDMARAVGKKTIAVAPWMVRIAFFWMWHLTRGRIPTSPGSWRGYSYPIAVDGSKVTRKYGYQYQYESLEAFQYTHGRYEAAIPPEARTAPPVA